MKFDSLNPEIYKSVQEMGYIEPTPIQAEAIPAILTGGDLLGLAQTGTGKTAAFVLPILQQLLHGPRKKTRALILAPTRELAAQINEAIQDLGRHTNLRSAVVFGGVSMNPQIAAMKRGTEIIVACPGRLLDHINQGNINLAGIETFVLDEADRMFDMGFLPDIRRIIKQLPVKRQNLFFSATMPPDIRKLSQEILQDATTVQIGHTKPANTVAHALYPVPQHLKTALLKEVLKSTPTESVIVFTRTKHRAKRLAQQLERSGYRATSLQGNLSQNKREHAIKGFRDGSYQIMVATDIAARGIDVSAISHVINFDMPDTADAYTHRIGRTGRAAKTGEAFTFITGEDKAMVNTIERTLGEKLERKTMPEFDYDAPKPKQDQPPSRPPRRPAAPNASKRPGAMRSGRPSNQRRSRSANQ